MEKIMLISLSLTHTHSSDDILITTSFTYNIISSKGILRELQSTGSNGGGYGFLTVSGPLPRIHLLITEAKQTPLEKKDPGIQST